MSAAAPAPARAARLAMAGMEKQFPGVRALRGASLTVAPGEVHVLLGENGAGKSTLMKILGGQYPADAGSVTLDGAPYAPRSPHEAQRRGIAMIHQELSIIPALTVAENLLLGDEPARLGVIDAGAQAARARALLAAVGADIDPDRPAATLSVAEMQLTEIAKALRHEARLLIMDEPTAALTEAEADTLFGVIRGLTARGVSVVYISHRMPEIFAIGDRVTVMRDGATVTTLAVAEASVDGLIAAMVGRRIEERVPKRAVTLGDPVLVVRELASAAVGPVSFTIRAGEILGLAGLMGSGRTEVARAVFGADPAIGGEVAVGGRRLDGRGRVRDAIDAGVGFVTEDRKLQGLLLDSSAAVNVTLAALPRPSSLARAGIIDLAREAALAEGYRERLHIRLPSVHQNTRTLSGGNQQKLVIARWLAVDGVWDPQRVPRPPRWSAPGKPGGSPRDCRVLILDEPTRGVDVGAKAEIYGLIGDLAARGVAILLISSELPEVLGLSDRVAVMRDRRLAGILPAAEATQERVLQLAVG